MKPAVHYFPIRGRAEYLKLALAAAGQEFDVKAVDYAAMKSDTNAFPFAQCPTYEDEDGYLCQSNAILRHIGRKFNMYGSSESEMCSVDIILDGVESLRVKYGTLIYVDELNDDAKAAYWSAHLDPESAQGRNGGAHFLYLAKLLEKNNGGNGFAVGSTITIADIQLFDICDLHQRIYGDKFKATYPKLAAHFERVAAVPGVKAYLESELRLEKVNNNNLG